MSHRLLPPSLPLPPFPPWTEATDPQPQRSSMFHQLLPRRKAEPESVEALARQEGDYGRTLYKLIWVQLWLSMLTQVI